jgi:uncharacterized membrane protein
MRDLELAVLWQAIWLAAAAATVPWLRWLHLPARPAQGIALAAGPALVVLPLWWVGMLSGIPFTRATLFLVSSLLALVGWGLVIARGQSWQSLTEIIRAWPLLLVHTGAFALYALFRSYNPAIRYTEKPMELAFLSAAWANPHLPPPDPWFAGRPINYYTFGYVEFGAIAKTLGCQPEFAFNLALASLFASAVTAAYVATWLLATGYGAKARFSWEHSHSFSSSVSGIGRRHGSFCKILVAHSLHHGGLDRDGKLLGSSWTAAFRGTVHRARRSTNSHPFPLSWVTFILTSCRSP